ncbi:hypothetical protein Agub_g14773 [Astrephomene gubernaculifera]|uniref:Protein kinase domain-containing protein n=1 Tax=Astrephomene gubernaculifera TaxID=47775 RepID=A0AAD3E426_9CHLO|nr:hypothetical protein Agub_g14773 [Astrephomene gubernaculifera]
MSQQVDSSLSVPASVPSVRALQSNPEVLTPVRHGFLWKRSRMFKTWLSRWFQLDENGFLYAISPKAIKQEGRPVLASAVREVLSLPPQRYRNGATMYGIRVVAINGSIKDIFTDDHTALQAWALDLSRSTVPARERAAAKAAAAVAATPARPLPLPPPMRPAPLELRLADLCETDWSHALGSGLFACVLRGRMHGTGEAVAVKIVKAEAYREYSDIIHREAVVWAAAGSHPHIVQLKQVLKSPNRMYFIAELCEGGGLIERLAASATYCEREVAWLVRQLLAAVQHLHDNAIVHMDIKPENVVFVNRREDSAIKLIDFSLASFFYSPTDPGGTPEFVAPELLNRPEHYAREGCGPEVDMWAVGVVLFYLLSGQTPFQAPSLDAVLQRVKSGEWAFHGRRWALVSEGARDLVSCLLRFEPSQRLTAAEALAHPWLRRPDSLSQALLQDAVAAFKSAALASQQQLRSSWVKQVSGELMMTAGTNASPHTSLSRFASMSVGAATSLTAGAAAVVAATGGPGGGPMPFAGGMPGDGVIAGMGPGGALVMSSHSHHQLLQPSGYSGRGSPAGSVRPSAHSAHSARSAAAAAAGGAASRLSPHGSSLGNSPHGSPGGAARSPRSPLGMRTRRASDTLAYTLAITERQESLSQMQAQGIPVPTTGALQWPALSMAAAAKARRASIGPSLSPSGSQADMATGGSMTSRVGSGGGGSGGGGHSPSGTTVMRQPYMTQGGLPYHGSGHMVGINPHHHRGTSGLSVMTSASSLVATRGAAGDGKPNGGRSYPELNAMRVNSASTVGGRSGANSSADTTPHSSSRDGPAPRTSWTSLPAHMQQQAHQQLHSQLLLQQQQQPQQQRALQQYQQHQQQSCNSSLAAGSGVSAGGTEPAAVAGTGAAGEAAGLPASDQALLSHATSPKVGVATGKSQSYHVIPSTWLDGQGRPVGRSQSTGYGTMPAAAAAAATGMGPAAAGPGTGSTSQRRASMSFTLGGSGGAVPAAALMPHGPSPLSNASGARSATTSSAAVVVAAAAAVGKDAALLIKRPSRNGGAAAGGIVKSRSGSSTPVQGSPGTSAGNVPQYGCVANTGGSASGPMGPTAAVGVSGMGLASSHSGSNSMYAAVLRANLSGHGLSVGSSGGGGGGGPTSDSGGDGFRRMSSRSGSGSPGGSATHVHVAAAGDVAAGMGGKAMWGAAAPPPPPPSGPSGVCGGGSINLDSGGGGCGRNSGSESMATRESVRLLAEQLNVPARTCSGELRRTASDAVSERGALQELAILDSDDGGEVSEGGNAVTDGASPHHQGLLPRQHPSSSSAAPARHLSPPNVTLSAQRSESPRSAFCDVAFATEAAATIAGSTHGAGSRLGGAPSPSKHASHPPPQEQPDLQDSLPLHQQRRPSSASLPHNFYFDSGEGPVVMSGIPGRPLSGPQTSFVDAAVSCSAKSNAVVGGGGSGAGAGAGAGVDGRYPSGSSSGCGSGAIAELLRSTGLAPRASSRLALETIPSEDPETLSGLLLSVREERAAAAAAAAAASVAATTTTGTPPAGTPHDVPGTGSVLRAASPAPGSPLSPAWVPHGKPPQQQLLQQQQEGQLTQQTQQQQQQQQLQSTRQPSLKHLRPTQQHSQSQPQSPSGLPPLPPQYPPHAAGTSQPSSPAANIHARAFLTPQASRLHGKPQAWENSTTESPTNEVVGGGADGGDAAAVTAGAALAQRALSNNSPTPRRSVRRSVTASSLRQHATTAAAQAAAAAAAAAARAAGPPADADDEENDPFADWNYPPPAARRRASSIGLSGASLAALLAQAAPLAQAAQANAAAQIASSQASSFSVSRHSSFSNGHRAMLAAALGPGYGAPGGGGGVFPGGASSIHSAGNDSSGSLHSGGGGISPAREASPRTVRRSTTAASLTASLGLPRGQQSPLQAYAGGDAAGAGGGSGHGQGMLSKLLAQALPMAQAAQAHAAAQQQQHLQSAQQPAYGMLTSSGFSFTEKASLPSGAASANSSAAAGYGTARGAGFNSGTYGSGSNSGVVGYVGSAASGGAMAAAAATGGGRGSNGGGAEASWVRRSTTAHDLREQSAAPAVQLSGHSMVHRLAHGQQQQQQQVGGGYGTLPSASPPKDPGSPNTSLRTTSRGVPNHPSVPSRLSNSGAGSASGRFGGGGSGLGASSQPQPQQQ